MVKFDLSDQHLGERVLLEHLLYNGKYPGTIIGLDCEGYIVKLDRQEAPVHMVMYFESRPEGEIMDQRWQFCYPYKEEK